MADAAFADKVVEIEPAVADSHFEDGFVGVVLVVQVVVVADVAEGRVSNIGFVAGRFDALGRWVGVRQ